MKNGYEKTDWDFWVVTKIGACIIAMLIISHFAAGWTLHHFTIPPAKPDASVLERNARLPPEPRLQVNPTQDLKTMRAEEDLILTSYDWIDHAQGIVRIPIERAIDLTAQRGLPHRAQLPQNHKETLP